MIACKLTVDQKKRVWKTFPQLVVGKNHVLMFPNAYIDGKKVKETDYTPTVSPRGWDWVSFNLFWNILLKLAGIGGGTPIDTDAQTFFGALSTAGVPLTPPQQDAINTLVTTLKAKGLWTRLDAIYPMIGGTATSHKFNLKDPRDVDAAFRLVYTGSITHDANGMTPAGGYADTKHRQITARLNDNHIAYYTRVTTPPSKNAMMGASDVASFNNGIYLYIDAADNHWYVKNYRAGVASDHIASQLTQGNNPGLGGLFVNTRVDAGGYYLYRNGIGLFGGPTGYIPSLPSSAIGTGNMLLGGINVAGGTWNCVFASIGWGLNATQNMDLYNAVQAYQTSLNRQV